jgi:hypothetical protein
MSEPIDLKITTATAFDVEKVQALFPDWTFVEGPMADQELAAKRSGGVRMKLWILSRRQAEREADQRTTVLLYLHHVIADGWSIPLTLREIASILEAAGK